MAHEKERDAIIEILHTLGDTEEKVAEKLRSDGIKGSPAEAQYCPVAHYIHYHGVRGASVWGTFWHFGEHYGDLPDSVSAFIEAFDDMAPEYADLVA